MTLLRRILRVLAYGSAALIAVLLVATAVERVVWRGKVLPGVELIGASVSGKGADAVDGNVARAAARLESEPFVVHAGDAELTLDPSDIDLRVDTGATSDSAQDAGRTGSPVGQLLGTVLRFSRNDEVTWGVSFDEKALDAVVDEWAEEVAVDARDGSLRFNGATVTPVAPKRGVKLSRLAADRVIVEALRMGRQSGVLLPVATARPSVTRAEVEEAAAKARALLETPVTINLDTIRVRLSPAELGGILTAEPKSGALPLRIDHEKLKDALGEGALALEGPPENARFSVDGTRVNIVPHRVGRIIDLDDLEKKILAGHPIVAGTFEEEQPEKTTEDLEGLGIEELISSFTTRYPAGQPRVKNIQKAAGIVDDTIVRSGTTFSLNDTLGVRTQSKGWVVAPVIEAGEFREAVGGGISQFATTMFNAAFFGGFPLTEYKAHTFYISRYPMGREATVSHPSPDLKWQNDSEQAVLIRTSGGATSVTVNFYSTKIRRVEATSPEIVERIAVPEEVVVDAAVPLGMPQTRESGSEGSVVRVSRVMTSLDGEEIGRKTYTTRYRPQKRVVAYHPCDHPDPAMRPPPESPECQAPPPSTTTTTVPPGAGPP